MHATTSKPKAYSYKRFSTTKQEKGDSLKRQTETAHKICDLHNLELQNVTFVDLGISAFRGRHAQVGALAQFISGVEEGQIESGSWLIIESLDRLTREAVDVAMDRCKDLFRLGITIATGRGDVYPPDTYKDVGQLFRLVIDLERANRESERKSEMITKAWSTLRENIVKGKKVRPNKIPFWISMDEDKNLILNDHKGEVERLFELLIEGKSIRATATILDQEFERKWYSVKVRDFLKSDIALGVPRWTKEHEEFAGSKNINLYPPVISVETLEEARARAGKVRGSGAKPKAIAEDLNENLFKSMAYCSCGGKMVKMLKGDTLNHLYIRCRTAMNSYQSCSSTHKAVELIHLESAIMSILNHFGEFCSSSKGLTKAQRAKKDEVEKEIASQKATLGKLSARLEVATSRLLDESDQDLIDVYTSAVKDLKGKSKDLNESIAQLESSKRQLSLKSTMKAAETLADIYTNLEDPKGRATARAALVSVVERIDLNPEKNGGVIHVAKPYPASIKFDLTEEHSGHWEGKARIKNYTYNAVSSHDNGAFTMGGRVMGKQVRLRSSILKDLREAAKASKPSKAEMV